MDNRVLLIENEPNGAGISFMFQLRTLFWLIRDFSYFFYWLNPYIGDLKKLLNRIMSFIDTKLDDKTKNRITSTIKFFKLSLNENESEWSSLDNNKALIENTINELNQRTDTLDVEITDVEAIENIISDIKILRTVVNQIKSSLPSLNLRGRMNERIVENSKEECEKCE